MASPKSNPPVKIAISVTLQPKAFEYLKANAREGDLNDTLAGWVEYFMERQSRGGLMLEPEDHDYLAGLASGKRFKDSRSLVVAVEKGLKREDGQHAFVVRVDPANYPAVEDTAKQHGFTVEEFMDGFMQTVFANGMLYDFTPVNGRAVPFTFQMIESCKALCGKTSIDSSDIAGMISEDRLLPITREVKAQCRRLLPDKVDFSFVDISALFTELESARKELAELRRAPVEVAA